MSSCHITRQAPRPVEFGNLTMATVLFVCLHNAGRSQMSQALFGLAAEGRHALSRQARRQASTFTQRSPRSCAS